MKIKKMIHVSFSDNVVDITVPRSWSELDQSNLTTVYTIMSDSTAVDVRFKLFCHFARLRVVRESEKSFLCGVTCDDGIERAVIVSPMQMLEYIETLDFIYNPGDIPVRLDMMRGHKAVDAELHGVKFSDYISMENYYQGYLLSKDSGALRGIAAILYPGWNYDSLTASEELNILNWSVQVKNNFSRMFRNFFKPVSNQECGEQPSPVEVMNNEIRALTGGDLTKEETVLASDCWRALTELDYKAKEAEEYKRMMQKNN